MSMISERETALYIGSLMSHFSELGGAGGGADTRIISNYFPDFYFGLRIIFHEVFHVLPESHR